MGNRLSKLATRTGDDGTTGIAGNKRYAKNSSRIEAIGTVDELNSVIGMVVAQGVDSEIQTVLEWVQQRLFDLGGEFAMPDYAFINEQHIAELDRWVEEFNGRLAPLKEFILPKGDLATTTCHLARTVCRRAERRVVALKQEEVINDQGLVFLNRLSDLLFVFCRILAKRGQQQEVMWQSRRTKSE